jgi:hypothetical protein
MAMGRGRFGYFQKPTLLDLKTIFGSSQGLTAIGSALVFPSPCATAAARP